MEDRALRFFGCDGFIPQEYLIDDPSPRITGLAWIGSVPRQEQWAFELVLPNTVRSLEHVPWHTLLPAEDVTDWLSIDLERSVRFALCRRLACRLPSRCSRQASSRFSVLCNT
jgi:hypothetical protein